MQQYSLSKPLVDGIINYLANRPYGEVFQLIGGLQQEAAPQLKAFEEASKQADLSPPVSLVPNEEQKA